MPIIEEPVFIKSLPNSPIDPRQQLTNFGFLNTVEESADDINDEILKNLNYS